MGIQLAEKGGTMIDTQEERLPCALTESELRARGEEIAKLIGDQEVEELEKKDSADTHNAEIKKLQTKQAQLAQELRERREYRWIPVKKVRVENTHLIQWIRTDTGEIVRERPMTEDERQLEIFPGGAANDVGVASGTES